MVSGIGGGLSRSGEGAGGSAEASGEVKAGVQEVDVKTILKQLHGNLQGRRLGGGNKFTCFTSTQVKGS